MSTLQLTLVVNFNPCSVLLRSSLRCWQRTIIVIWWCKSSYKNFYSKTNSRAPLFDNSAVRKAHILRYIYSLVRYQLIGENSFSQFKCHCSAESYTPCIGNRKDIHLSIASLWQDLRNPKDKGEIWNSHCFVITSYIYARTPVQSFIRAQQQQCSISIHSTKIISSEIFISLNNGRPVITPVYWQGILDVSCVL